VGFLEALRQILEKDLATENKSAG